METHHSGIEVSRDFSEITMDAQGHSKLFNNSKNRLFQDNPKDKQLSKAHTPSISVTLQAYGDHSGRHQLSLEGAGGSITAQDGRFSQVLGKKC